MFSLARHFFNKPTVDFTQNPYKLVNGEKSSTVYGKWKSGRIIEMRKEYCADFQG